MGLSVVVTWLTKEITGVLGFTLGGLKAGLPLNFYNCSFISNCSTDYVLFIVDAIFWLVVIWLVWKFVFKSKK